MIHFFLLKASITTGTGMLFACWAILIMLVAGVVAFLRAQKKGLALSVLPLGLVPLFHIFSRLLAVGLGRFFPFPVEIIRLAIDLLAALAACILTVLLARRVRSRRFRLCFSIGSCLFILVLSAILITSFWTFF